MIGRRAIETPTNRPEEMLLKIRLCLWFMGVAPYKKLEDLDRWRPGPQLHREIEHDTLAALRDDLHRLASRCANLNQPPSRRAKVIIDHAGQQLRQSRELGIAMSDRATRVA